MSKELFTFISCTYNHERYILEHLESIRYQIETYGQNYSFQFLVADDCSQDRTVALINSWLTKYSYLFEAVSVVSDNVNHGTCFNITKVWPLVKGESCKVLAGDDVYSENNLFAAFDYLKENDIVYGLPLILIDGKLLFSKREVLLAIASSVIYNNKPFIVRQKRVSLANTPGLIMRTEYYHDSRIVDFMRRFKVVEDWPEMIKIAELYNPRVFQSKDVLVYYRRTGGSTYIQRSSVFEKDNNDIFNYLIETESSPIEKILLKNRQKCRFLKMKKSAFCNLNYYIFAFKFLLHVFSIMKGYRNAVIEMCNIEEKQKHFDLISYRAKAFMDSIGGERQIICR